MTKTTRALYNLAMKDKDFHKEILEADGDTPPRAWEDNRSKAIFACVYYGWIVANKKWKQIKHLLSEKN